MRHAIAVVLALGLVGAPVARAAGVVQFTPEGLAKGVRQVVARFDADIVPLGDPRASAEAFSVDCAVPGRARWTTSREWVFDFERDLPAGLRCRFELVSGLETLSGIRVSGRRAFTFETGGPAVVEVRPYPGSSRVEADQRFVLRLDAVPDAGSVERFARLEIAGEPSPVALRAIEGPERESAIRSAYWGRDPEPTDLVLEPVLRLPADVAVELVYGAGISAGGVATREPQRFAYRTEPELALSIHCERERAEAGCIPLSPIVLRFSQPVSVDAMATARLEPTAQAADAGPAGAVPASAAVALAFEPARSDDRSAHQGEFRSKGALVPQQTYRLVLPAALRDEQARKLAPIDPERLVVRIDRMPPLAKFSSPFGIVEAADPVLPVSLRGLEAGAGPPGARAEASARAVRLSRPTGRAIWSWLRATGDDPRWRQGEGAALRMPGDRSIFERAAARGESPLAPVALALPTQADGSTQVVGIPLDGPGLHAVDVASRVLGEALSGAGQTYHASALALVTDLAVHFKHGRTSALVWVTTLAGGEPVSGARIAIFDCGGAELVAGTTGADGLLRVRGLPEDLDAHDEARGCAWGEYERGLLVRAEREGDVSFLHTSWNRGIEPWRFDLPIGWSAPSPIVHSVLDRSLFRAGETVSMKHWLRAPVESGLAHVAAEKRPKKLRLVHGGSGDEVELPVEFDASGVALSSWSIPKTAKLGHYSIELEVGSEWLASGAFRVEAFRLPLLRAKLQGPRRPAVAGAPIELDAALHYLSGGPAAGLAVELRSQVRPLAIPAPRGLEEYDFARGDVRAGIERWESRFAEGSEGPRPSPLPAARALVLDASGGLRTTLDPIDASDVPREVLAELAFRDPNGELQTVAHGIPVHPSERLLGLRLDRHRADGAPLRLDVALLDLERRPVRAPVELELFERKVYSYRKRLVGGFYAYEHTVETKSLGPLCAGRTDRRGRFACSAPITATGQLLVRAAARDGQGRLATTHQSVWIPGPEDDWREASDSDRMDLVPEAREVEPGERARIEVRMPFRKATALVTLEREGILDAFVTRLSGRDPRVRVAIEAAHAPNVFVSVLAVRGRVATPAPTGRVDLARPASKLGITELVVGLAPHTLEVEVEPERAVHRVRERARVRIRVRTAEGERPPPGSELALAVVDEALLELSGNDSWKLLEAMHGRRSHDVTTYSAPQQVVGKRHFGLKARAAGGGGGATTTRELFDTLVAWQPRVLLDAQGEAVVEFALSDALSSFRIAAIAHAGVDRFGTGFARVRTTQDLMVLPGVAPVARTGDRMRPEFTVRNASPKAMQVEARLAVDGLGAGGEAPFEPIALSLAPGEAQAIGWELVVPEAARELVWRVEARAATGASDAVRVVQRVAPAVPERVLAAELVQIGRGRLAIPVSAPADAIPGRAGVEVALERSLGLGQAGLVRYFDAYPYGCLEQRASIAIGMRDPARWQRVMADLPGHLDEQGLARFFASDRLPGSDTLTAYLLAIAHEAKYAIPDAPRDRMLAALEAFVAGRLVRRSFGPVADEPLRRLAALEALARYGRARPEQLATLAPQPELWPTSGLLDGLSLAQRLAPAPAAMAWSARIEKALATRLTVGGTTIGFSSESRDGLDWLLATAESNVQRFLLLAHGSPRFAPDLPRLMKGALARRRDGHHQTTVANAWARLALERHVERFESEPVAGETTLALGAQARVLAWTANQAPPPARFELPVGGEAAPISLEATHRGSGRPWAEIQSRAALPLVRPLFSGFRIERSWTPIAQKRAGVHSRGDIVRVRIEVEAQGDAAWVVVDDPIPAGATILGSGLGRDSQIATAGERAGADAGGGWSGWGCPCRAYTERGELAYRDYYAHVPKGPLVLEYTMRLNQEGEFSLPPTRVEAMYAPESFGELPHERLRVGP